MLLSIPNKKTPETRSKAAGNTINVCPDGGSGCSYIGGDGIQQAVDSAQNGDTILLQPGRYTRRNPTDDPKIKYRYCMVNTRAKTLTIKGPGALLDGENGGIGRGKTDAEGDMIIGICDQGGDITIDSLQIKQTLLPAIFLRNSKAVIKNVTFTDIDNTTIDVWMGSKVIIVNNLFQGSAGPGVNILPLPGEASVKIENNTFFGNGFDGVNFILCNNSQPTGNVENNIIVNSEKGIGIECPEQVQKMGAIKIANNFVWKGKNTDCIEPPDKIPQKEDCSAGEICTGRTIAHPLFVGADEKGTVCVYGEGIVAGDFHTRSGSPAASAGAYTGVCADGNSSGCLSYIEQQKTQLIPPAPTEIPTQIIPTQPIINNPTQSITRPTTPDNGPPITYYLPPTMGFANPTQSPNNSPSIGTDNPTPTITPTPKPLIDVAKTVENAKNGINNLWISFLNFTKTILP